MKADLNVNWQEDQYLKRWLENKKKGTRATYLSAFRAYTQFTGLTAEEMIKESDEEMKLKPSERGIPERRVKAFFNWLKTEYVRKKRGKRKGEVVPVGERDAIDEKGASGTMAKTYVNAIRGFYAEFKYKIHIKRGEIEATPENRRFNFSIEDIKTLVEHAKSLRDRAIILCQFQGGMDESTLCSLNYWHVSRELESGKIPLLLDIKRPKITECYITYLAEDAINALKAYLAERRRKEQYDLAPNDPIFVRESWKRYKKQRIRPKTIQDLFRKLSLECEFVTEEELSETHWNPARPHGMRAAFQSLLRSVGVNQQDIDFMTGHKIPYQKAYYQQEGERLRKTYSEAMHILAVFTSTSYKVFEDRLTEQGLAIKTIMAENKEMKEQLNQLRINIGRRYGEVDRRTAVLIEGILLQIENDPELREHLLKNLGEQLRGVKVTERRR